ncbi:hypothetical protein, partial [Frankia sp. AvcI1]|uniref:hypothetical protein n=1 Tax=Frankia sp. AvcI1 TaxID=573496 RepID=UPI001F465432
MRGEPVGAVDGVAQTRHLQHAGGPPPCEQVAHAQQMVEQAAAGMVDPVRPPGQQKTLSSDGRRVVVAETVADHGHDPPSRGLTMTAGPATARRSPAGGLPVAVARRREVAMTQPTAA